MWMSSPTSGQTATTSGAREHARAQAAAVAAHMPIVPPSRMSPPPDGVDPARLVWAETVAPGGYAHKAVAAGTTIRLSDVEAYASPPLPPFRTPHPRHRPNAPPPL